MDRIILKKSAAAAGVGVALCLITGPGSASAQPAPRDTGTWAVENGVPHGAAKPSRAGSASSAPDLDSLRWQAQADYYAKNHRPPSAQQPARPNVQPVDEPSRLPDWAFPALGTGAAVALVAVAATRVQRRQQRPA